MNTTNIQKLTWALVIGMIIISLNVCLYTWKQSKRLMRRLDRMNTTVLELQDLARTAQADQACLQAFEALPKKKLTPLSELLLSAVPGIAADLHEQPSEQAVEGWLQHRTELTFENIPLKAMARFIMAAEQERPPWRVAECQIIASDTKAGNGRVNLVMEGLDKPGAQ